VLLTAVLAVWSLGAVSVSSPDAARVAPDFQKANEFYRDGDFQKATQIYERLAEAHPHEAVYYYNLGNSLFRMKRLGPAILAYERALLRAPRDPDVRHNLDFVRGLLEYQIEDKRNWYLRAGQLVLKRFTEREVRFIFYFAAFLFLSVSLGALIFKRHCSAGWFRRGCMIFLALSSLLLIAKHVERHVVREAVVLARECEVRYGPSRKDSVAFRLGDGLKVYVTDTRQDWSRVLLNNGESGWVPSEQIAEI
jgi:tetratricopeptide (TPR) repeat protein